MSLTENDAYPNIGMTVKASVEPRGLGYSWKIITHIIGPDDLLDRESRLFPTKKQATEDLINNFTRVVKEQYLELTR